MVEFRPRRRPPIAGDTPGREYRLVVGALKPGARSYLWTIIRDEKPSVPVKRSVETFRSLADAHAAGSVALREFRSEEAQSAKRK